MENYKTVSFKARNFHNFALIAFLWLEIFQINFATHLKILQAYNKLKIFQSAQRYEEKGEMDFSEKKCVEDFVLKT